MWCRSAKTKLKPVHVLGNTCYLLMSPYDLVCGSEIKGVFSSDKAFSIDGLLNCVSAANHLGLSKEESVTSRIAVSTKRICVLLTLVHVNQYHLSDAAMNDGE